MQTTTTMSRKLYTLSTSPQVPAGDFDDYDDDKHDYEGVNKDRLDQSEDDKDADDDNAILAEQLSNYSTVPSPTALQLTNLEDETLLDRLQQRLFIGVETHEGGTETKTVPRREPFSLRRSSLTMEDCVSLWSSKQKFLKLKLDQIAQRALLKTLSHEHSKVAFISRQEIAQMTARFRIFEEKKTRRLTAKRRETETHERIELCCAHTMNDKSRQITRQFPTFAERQAALLARKRQQRVQLEKRREEELTHDRAIDLQKSVRTPCICSQGNIVRSENRAMRAGCDANLSEIVQPVAETSHSRADGVHHTQACMRFMTMCSKMNASFAIQRKKKMMRRSLDDIIAFREAKKQRQLARAAIERAREDKKTTFMPRINAKSEKICAALIRSGKLDSELVGRMFKPRKTAPLPPKLSFKPTISKKSKWLLKKKQRNLTVTDDKQDTKVGTSRPLSLSSPDMFSRLEQLSHYGESKARHLERMHKEGQAPEATPCVEWNVVSYDAAKCHFILRGFDRPNALT